MNFSRLLLLAAISFRGFAPNCATAQNTNAFELLDGDRVVFVGDTLIERERSHGHIEYLLTTQFPDRNVTFRNLGWSADTPRGQSRVGFDHSKPQEVWFEQLTNSIAQWKPTVVFLGYGMANSFSGESALPQFIADLGKLMDAIQYTAGDARIRWNATVGLLSAGFSWDDMLIGIWPVEELEIKITKMILRNSKLFTKRLLIKSSTQTKKIFGLRQQRILIL